ncbi:LOW QUALITY PROTEIN: cleavage and polyadenylation specificity factor subunit 2-like [Dendronephthya gigantea]|uniref:LOW QUALITY PROTEIN: cleavage and polyadenylation specificity factor subunit 2-like n=1 Tax=Dendronephthya gigantea TaxID=151771 RepID=UPI00106A5C59|nr:LOW QUALITY PROTEIN: cleavage and polyadenylation specificity factor subunit 2-like [Dendronephthya gigantea]
MTSIIKLTVLSGGQDETPLAYLLQVDEFRFLLDCGWDESVSGKAIEPIKRHVNQIDAVLISHPDIYHLGALPYLVGNAGLTCPVYCTIPVYKMGQMFMYDFYQSCHNYEDFELFSLDDVDAAFDQIIQLKYSQHVSLKGKGHGLTITPYAAGHMIGGTMWKIVKDGEEDIIYAVDYNHKKERHLNGAVLETLSRPSLLITDSYNVLNFQARRRDRDTQLMSQILKTTRRGGNVLLAVDTAGRVLELSQLLDQLWRNPDSGLLAYSLALLNNVSYNVVEFAKSLVEWMSDKVMKSFEVGRNNPYQFKYCKLCHNLADLEKVPSPKVVLASMQDLMSGYAKDLFIEWAEDERNSIIFSTRTAPGSVARKLIDNPGTTKIDLEIKTRIKLEGAELERYWEVQKEKEKDKKITDSGNKSKETIAESDSDSEDEGVGLTFGGKARHDLMMSDEKRGNKSSFFKQAKSYPMFPCKEEKVKWDEYGEIIRPEDYVIPETTLPEEKKVKTEPADAVMSDTEMVPVGNDDRFSVPTKCVVEKRTIDIKCSHMYIDFEGRSDGESIKRIISIVKPRQLVVVHGSPEATKHLAEYCRRNSDMEVKTVFTPNTGETVDATRESHIYQIILRDSLVSALQFSDTRDAEIAWVDGQLIKEHLKSLPQEDIMDVDTFDSVPVLEQLPLTEIPGHDQVFINDPRLSDFKQILQKNGIQAEFAGGVLVCCNGVLAITRNEAGRIGLDGAVCDDYYKIRELLYEQFAIC